MSKLPQFFPATVYSPFKTYFDGEASMLSANNKSGRFDILPGHINFLCLLSPGMLRIETDGKATEFELNKGILQVVDGAAYVFVNI